MLFFNVHAQNKEPYKFIEDINVAEDITMGSIN
jgi:hypothetical protein